MHTFWKCTVFFQYVHLACVAGHVALLSCLFPHLKQPLILNLNFGLLAAELYFLKSFFELPTCSEPSNETAFFLLLIECNSEFKSPCLMTCICALVLPPFLLSCRLADR